MRLRRRTVLRGGSALAAAAAPQDGGMPDEQKILSGNARQLFGLS